MSYRSGVPEDVVDKIDDGFRGTAGNIELFPPDDLATTRVVIPFDFKEEPRVSTAP